jgi:hypothetical protein
MGWLFVQLWVLMAVAFTVGAGLTWIVGTAVRRPAADRRSRRAPDAERFLG